MRCHPLLPRERELGWSHGERTMGSSFARSSLCASSPWIILFSSFQSNGDDDNSQSVRYVFLTNYITRVVSGTPERCSPSALSFHPPHKPKEASVVIPTSATRRLSRSASSTCLRSHLQRVGTWRSSPGCSIGETLTWALSGPAASCWTCHPETCRQGLAPCWALNSSPCRRQVRGDLGKCFSGNKNYWAVQMLVVL